MSDEIDEIEHDDYWVIPIPKGVDAKLFRHVNRRAMEYHDAGLVNIDRLNAAIKKGEGLRGLDQQTVKNFIEKEGLNNYEGNLWLGMIILIMQDKERRAVLTN